MNIKMRRLVRTPSSEQYALFDPDRTDANYNPVSIGKLDLHYTTDGIYGTFLLWRESLQNLPEGQIQAMVEAAVQELAEPMGVPSFYAVEFFSPDLSGYHLHSSDVEAEAGEDSEMT
jgi:hypothetical protein